MNTITKTAAAALAALTIFAGSVGTSSQAHAFNGKKLLSLGIAAAVIGTVVSAAAAPRCQDIQRFDRWGNYRGTVRVCE